jgi:Protein of unknown function (DUF3105)
MKSGFLVLAAVLLLLAGCGGGDDDAGDAAHVNEESGSTNKAVLDERTGITPSPAKTSPGEKLVKVARKAGCSLLRDVAAKNEKVIPANAAAPEYEHEPPMSGPYVAPPHQQADGAYLTMPEQSTVVAAMNNGRMAIQYAPDLPERLQLAFKGLYDTMYGGTLLFPNGSMNYAVAATTWRSGLFCAGFEGDATLEAIRAFGRETWGKHGNVPVDKFPVEGPTPADPAEPRDAKSE